jgi:hypothetical protein
VVRKAALNGQPNCSILDGWWAEGYNGKNGWAIGEEREYHDPDVQAEADSLSLYRLLEEEIVPTYYDRGPDGIPHRWIATMKEAIRTCAPRFSMRRMVKEYTTRFYVPQIQHGMQIEQNKYEKARVLADWKEKIRRAWSSMEIYVNGRREGQLSLGEWIEVRAWVRADKLQPEDLCVELVYGEADDDQVIPRSGFAHGIHQEGSGWFLSLRYPLETWMRVAALPMVCVCCRPILPWGEARDGADSLGVIWVQSSFPMLFICLVKHRGQSC